MKLYIKLLSDLCTYSGESYNSMVDTDVVYDKYGIPYIPAKRIKGCTAKIHTKNCLEKKEISSQDFPCRMLI